MNLRAFKNTTRGLWVGRGLVAVGLVAMSVCVYFNARHGWNLGTIWPDKVALSTMHGLIDIATGLLVSAGAILFAWYMRKMGFAACAFALLLTLFSILSVSGFMSGRIAALEGQKAALAVMEKHSKWVGGTTYRNAGKTERRSLRGDMRDNLKEMVRVASLIPDSHAMAIASMLGWSVEAVQRTLILISSGMAQALKYVCLLVGFFLLSNRDERGAQAEPANQQNSGGSGGSGGGEPGKLKVVRPEPKPASARTMQAQHGAATPPPCGEGLGVGVNQATRNTSQSPSLTPPPQGGRTEPNNQSSARWSVISTDAPPGKKLPFDQFAATIRQDMAHGEPASSTRALALQTRWSQSSVVRQQKRVKEKANSHIRRFAGNGGGRHVSAMG